MNEASPILPEELLKPNFRARAAMHVLGLVIAIVLVSAGGSPPILVIVALVVVPLAFYQTRTCSIRDAWVVDVIYAVIFSYASKSAVGPAMIIGWAAVIGLVDEEHDRLYPVGSGLAGLAAALVMQPEITITVVSVANALGVAASAFLFVHIFRFIGGLLREHDAELRAFFDRVPVALTRTSPEGELLEFNQATAELFGDVILGEQVVARYVDPDRRRQLFDQLSRDGSVHGFEARLITGPGEAIEALISANAVNDDGGRLRFIESAIFDFTSLHQLERERERLARLIDATSDLVALGTWDGSIRYANPAVRSWVRRHVTDEEYIDLGQPISRSDEEMMVKALRADGSWAGALTVRGREGDRTVSVLAQVLDIGGEPTIASISRDVTDEINTERQLKELIRAKDELVASISHEIRTPLSVVMGLASEVRDNYVDFDRETHEEFASLIADQGQEMANIVEDLLVAARADSGSIVLVPGAVDLQEETSATLRALPDAKRVRLIENRARHECWGDASRIRQILRNLIINAQRYGGEKVVVTTRRDGDVIVLEVTDDGPGVPSPEVAMIFEPFGRAHAAGTQPGSIGLGLSVSRDLARRMGGDLEYVRREEATVFRLTLPVYPPARDAHAPIDARGGVE
jgi:PAS domain S-box-containing protein